MTLKGAVLKVPFKNSPILVLRPIVLLPTGRYLASPCSYHRTGRNYRYDLHNEIGCLGSGKFQVPGIEERKKGWGITGESFDPKRVDIF
jgi:hypothetical protein